MSSGMELACAAGAPQTLRPDFQGVNTIYCSRSRFLFEDPVSLNTNSMIAILKMANATAHNIKGVSKAGATSRRECAPSSGRSTPPRQWRPVKINGILASLF